MTTETEHGVRRPNFPDRPDLSRGGTALPDAGRHEPVLAAAAPLGEFHEAMRLDPTRRERDPTPPHVKRSVPRGAIDSLILHLLALVMIIGLPSRPPADIPAPIPVALVIEQPPPQPEEPKPAAAPVQGRRASDDFAEVEAPKAATGAGDAAQAAGAPQPPAAETQSAAPPPSPPPPAPDRPTQQAPTDPQPTTAETAVAVVTPPPPPTPAPPTPAPPKPAAQKTLAALRPPKPLGSEWPLPLSTDHPQAPVRTARLTGPAAVRDEYCVRLLSLTLRNIGLLPLAAIGARHGETVVTFRLTGDGTLNSVKVVQSSGYPDIDERIVRMVTAVGRFPPLPPRIPGDWMDFTFNLHFPHPLQR